MALETDLLLDRVRLKRWLNVWRVVAVLAVLGAVLVAVLPGGAAVGSAHIARLNVRGIIQQDRKLLERVDRLANDTSVRAVIVSVDSPGGSVAGGTSLRAALIRLAAKKPVVTVMEGTAASAAYMISLPSARIFASEATLTGSIGVILETGEASGLLDRLGLRAEAITSGPLKDQPSFTRPLTTEGRAYLHGIVDDLYDQFVTMVAEGRHMEKARVTTLADGRAFTGRQALAAGLVDQIGGEIEARTWLETERQVAAGLPIRDVSEGSFLDRARGAAVSGLTDLVSGTLLVGRVRAGGAWSVWQGGGVD